MSIIKGNVYRINEVYADSPKIMVYVLKDGRANYNILKEEQKKESKETTEEANFNIELKGYSINNGKITYVDKQNNMTAVINNLNHKGSGDFSQDNFLLKTKTIIDELTFEFGGVEYLNKVKTSLDMELDVNNKENKFTLNENKLSLNNLLLKFDGIITVRENIGMNLKFNSARSNFKDIISLIPTIYKNDFVDLESSGSMNISGNVNGFLTEEKIPTFDLTLSVENGMFKYSDLPTPINNVNALLNVNNKDGVINNTIINLSKIHVELDKEPIDGNLRLSKIKTGPEIDIFMNGKIDLANLNSALKIEGIKTLEGMFISDFSAKGNLANIETNVNTIDAKGSIKLSAFKYSSEEFPEVVRISNAHLFFTPKNVRLNNFNCKIGESDISAKGYLNNVIAFVLSDAVLKGSLILNSNYFNFNPFITSNAEAKTSKGEQQKKEAFNIPENITFTMNSSFKKLLYDNLELTNLSGNVSVKNGKVFLDNLDANLLNGKISGSGYYTKTVATKNPDINFNMSISNFDVKEIYNKFISIQEIAPMAKYLTGTFNSSFSLTSSLDSTLMPIWDSFFSNGNLTLPLVQINGFSPLNKVADALKLQALSNPSIRNIKPKFEIKKGRFYLSPFNFKVGNYNIELSGSNGLDQSLDYTMKIDVPAKQIKETANSAISSLLGKKANLIKSNTIKVLANIGGTITKPKIKTSTGDAAGNIVEETKKQVVEQATTKFDSAKAKTKRKLEKETKKQEEKLKKKLKDKLNKKKLKKIFG